MSSALSASNGPDAASQAFGLLAEPVRRWVYDQGWQTLRDAQEAAIPVLLAGSKDAIIAAATADGKTEAAFLPIISRLDSDPARVPGARVPYGAPPVRLCAVPCDSPSTAGSAPSPPRRIRPS